MDRRNVIGRQQLAYVASQAADTRLPVELESEGMTLSLGPQHPATHGSLRILVTLDREQVVAAEPLIGYMHRGYEKLVETRPYPQINTLVNRIDWLGSFSNEVPFIIVAEQLLDVQAPERARWLRNDLLRVVEDRQPHVVPRRHGGTARCVDTRLLRIP